MRNFRISILLSLFLVLSSWFLVTPVYAVVCSVCTVAVCAGVGLSRYLGVDDTISGVWVGGVIVSFISWTINYLNKKNIRFLFRKPSITLLYYFFVIFPLYQFKLMGHPQNKFKFIKIDKLLIGIISGSIFFILAVMLNDLLKKKNGGKAYFPFQKVVIPLLSLGINSLIFYYLSCR